MGGGGGGGGRGEASGSCDVVVKQIEPPSRRIASPLACFQIPNCSNLGPRSVSYGTKAGTNVGRQHFARTYLAFYFKVAAGILLNLGPPGPTFDS